MPCASDMLYLQDGSGSSAKNVSLGTTSDAVPSGDAPKEVTTACTAILEAEPKAQSSAVEQERVKDAADTAGGEDVAEVKWYKDSVVSKGSIAIT